MTSDCACAKQLFGLFTGLGGDLSGLLLHRADDLCAGLLRRVGDLPGLVLRDIRGRGLRTRRSVARYRDRCARLAAPLVGCSEEPSSPITRRTVATASWTCAEPGADPGGYCGAEAD